ncbi:hypothetical protein W01_04570 [Candidatus Nitrotoga sp. AM1P]|nr:hypothetical protein W01_04570 [Candidatus Nitrotoga sp. AM1P]
MLHFELESATQIAAKYFALLVIYIPLCDARPQSSLKLRIHFISYRIGSLLLQLEVKFFLNIATSNDIRFTG